MGSVVERLGRRWLVFELDRGYLAASAFRFAEGLNAGIEFEGLYRDMVSGLRVEMGGRKAQPCLRLMEENG
jgi:hypothetical protein